MAKEYSLGGVSGKVHQTTNSFSGTKVSVYHSEQAGMDSSEGCKYHAVCEDHGNMISETSISRAKSAAIDSPSWCEDCGKIADDRAKSRNDHFKEGSANG